MEIIARIAGVIIKEGKLLLLRGKNHTELWTPGGKINGNESDEECLRRELKEEIGVTLLTAKFFKEYQTYSFYHPEKKMVERVYFSEIEGVIKPAAEIKDVIWLTQDDYNNKKFSMITLTEKELIPDILKAGLW